MQPIGGLFADVMEPRYLLSTFAFLTATGTLIIGFSTNYYLSCAARCLVGIGCGPVYVPIVRIIADLFSPGWFNILNGITMSCGSIGAILAAGPLASLVKYVDWQWTFYATAGIGFVISILTLLFVKTPQKDEHPHLKDKFKQLYQNFMVVSCSISFWKLASWSITCGITFFILTSFWASSYLTSFFEYTNEHAGYIVMMLSLASILGSPLMTFLSEALHTRKWIVVSGSFVTFSISTFFFILNHKISEAYIWVLLFLFGAFTSAVVPVAVTMFKEMTTPETTATAAGLANFYATVSSVSLQALISILAMKIDPDHPEKHQLKAYKYGLWLPFMILTGLSVIGILSTPDTYQKSHHPPPPGDLLYSEISDSKVND